MEFHRKKQRDSLTNGSQVTNRSGNKNADDTSHNHHQITVKLSQSAFC